MKIVLNTVVFAVIAVASATMAVAQPPGGGQGGHRGGPGGHGGNDPGRAVLMALDTDKNHEISAAEISNVEAKDRVVNDSVASKTKRELDLTAKMALAASTLVDLQSQLRWLNMQCSSTQMETENLTQPSCLTLHNKLARADVDPEAEKAGAIVVPNVRVGNQTEVEL